MKRHHTYIWGNLLLLALVATLPTSAQWTTSGSNIYTNPLGNYVGIGTTTPVERLQIGTSTPLTFHDGGWKIISSNADYQSGTWKFMESSAARYAVQTVFDPLYGTYRIKLSTSTGNAGDAITWYDGLVMNYQGEVGLGTYDPTTQLHLQSHSPIIMLGSDNHEGWPGIRFAAPDSASGSSLNRWQFVYNARDNYLYLNDYTANKVIVTYHDNGNMLFDPAGNVGIGTTAPAYKLDVDGDLRAELIVVEVVSGADYVFDDDYDLRPLEEVARYVRQHRHLPGVAPAAEMEAEGVEVGAFQMTLLEKVEELTLYLIELQQENKALQADNEALQADNEAMATVQAALHASLAAIQARLTALEQQ